MMKIYIDENFKCYAANDGTMREIETDFFDGKCPAFIEGYRYIPVGEAWTRSDGEVFTGEMISPWKDYNILAAYQEQYELDAINNDADLLSELDAAFKEGVNSI